MSNHKNPAIKRIMADVKELNLHPSHRYHATPLETNMFEWHFTIRGPPDTAFEGGIYHGRILLPAEYPFKPPNIVFLTKNGRFEVGTKICLSISAYHEESWQPAWGVRTMLEAIISFFPSEGAGAIGALDWTPAERKKLATESKSYCCALCGPISELLSEPPPSDSDASLEDGPDETILSQISQLQMTQKSSDSSKSPSESSKIQSCGECKESPSVAPLQTAEHKTEETAHTGPPSVGIPDASASPGRKKSDFINDMIFVLLIMVGGMVVGLVCRICLKVSASLSELTAWKSIHGGL